MDGRSDGLAEASVVERAAGRLTESPGRPPVRSGRIVSITRRAARATGGVRYLGLTFDALGTADAAQLVAEQAGERESFVYVATPNVDHRVRLQREPDLISLYESAWMTLCDSRVIGLLARIDGIRLWASPGADLVEELFRHHIQPNDPINVIGSSRDVVETLKARFSLTRVHWHSPPMNLRNRSDAIDEAAEFVSRNPSALTFICVGSPQQELVAQAILDRGDACGVGLCCGASLDFLSGKVPRAPRWMRNLTLEWLHRWASDPVRLSQRYLRDGPNIFPIWLSTRRLDAGGGDDGGTSASAPEASAEQYTIHPAA